MGIAELQGARADPAAELRRRARLVRLLRIAMLAFVVGYFFAPYAVQAWIPPWVPFLVAVCLEVQFFVGGYLQGRRGMGFAPAGNDPGPQPRDLAELGGDEWREATA